MNTNIRTIGGALGTAVVSAVVVASAHGSAGPTHSGWTGAFWTLTGLAAVGAGVAALVPSGRTRPAPAAPAPVPARVPAPVEADADLATILTL